MTEPYLFEKAIGQQMGDLCRLAVGDAKVTQTGEIVTLEEMLGRGTMGVSVEVPYTSSGVSAVGIARSGDNIFNISDVHSSSTITSSSFTKPMRGLRWNVFTGTTELNPVSPEFQNKLIYLIPGEYTCQYTITGAENTSLILCSVSIPDGKVTEVFTFTYRKKTYTLTAPIFACFLVLNYGVCIVNNLQFYRGTQKIDYAPYTGYYGHTITLPADFYGGSINLEAGTVTSRYAADGSLLAAPVVTEIDPISIPILAGVNNVWADVGTVTVSYYAADAETFRPALWYPTIYRGLTSARYLIKSASGAIASFSDAIAAPLVWLRVALPWRSEGWQSVSVTVNGTLTTISLPTTIYGGYLDVVTGQLVATHDADGNLLSNQKLYFLDPVNISALAGVNNVWSDAGDVAVSYRIDNG